MSRPFSIGGKDERLMYVLASIALLELSVSNHHPGFNELAFKFCTLRDTGPAVISGFTHYHCELK